MINVKEAVGIAVRYFADLMGQRAEGTLLEEVEFIEENGKSYWKVTLSTPADRVINQYMAGRYVKDYKLFTIDAESGEVKSMRIRQLDAA